MAIKLEEDEYYRLDFGSGNEDNYMIGKFEKEDACNYYWSKHRLKKWSNFPEHLDCSGYTVKSCKNIRLATNEEIKRLEVLVLKKFLSEFDEGEQLGHEFNADVCQCGKSVNATYHYHHDSDTISDIKYCEDCNESWGSGDNDIFEHLYMYFVEGKELFCIKRDKMFIEPSAYSRWKKEQKS